MKLGIVEWFRPGEHERVERVLEDLKALGIKELRTGVSWADWYTPEGEAWYSWLLPRLARDVNLLPCFVYTPPSLGEVPKTSSPPRDLKAYADFLDVVISQHGACFDWLELWNEPNNLNDWDWRRDPDWLKFSEMLGMAAHWAKARGKKTVLAGMCPTDPNWLTLICKRGVMQYIDAVGLHGFPDTWDFDSEGWETKVSAVHAVLSQFGHNPEIWLTEVGYATWRHDEDQQLRVFLGAMAAPVTRVYWYAAHDLHPELSHQDGFHKDERHYHFGLKKPDGRPKLLFRLLQDYGVEGVREVVSLARLQVTETQPVLITGGAGFVGTNLADRLASAGQSVLLYDNLSRPGVETNLRWLKRTHGDRVQVEVGDLRDAFRLREAVQQAAAIFHLAAQVAVTTSLTNPADDFEVNARGTLNLLEALRGLEHPVPLVFTSTNKVYGALDDLAMRQDGRSYTPKDAHLLETGIDEERPLDFHSPYGCSKGTADQYVLDYSRSFGLPTAVFRMSCIYGPHQCGTEDQGWVAHFLIRAIEGEPITLYGDGMQVRDLLFVDDLLDAFLLVKKNIDLLAGLAFNIGGGPDNSVSLLEVIDLITALHGEKPSIRFRPWRQGDQRYFVSATGKFSEATGWKPKVKVQQGTERLYRWLLETRDLEELRAKERLAS